jgi:integrase
MSNGLWNWKSRNQRIDVYTEFSYACIQAFASGRFLGLTWDNVDLEKGMVHITKTVYRAKDEGGAWKLCEDRPKTKASDRVVPLPDYIANMLRRDFETAQTPYVVENKKGERMPIRSYQYLFEKLTRRADVRKLNFHALLHTFATRAIECGMGIKTVSEIMGHQNASITLNRYAHCMMEHKVEMMRRLPKVL